MLIASYNKETMGDILITMIRPDAEEAKIEQKGSVVRIADAKTNETTGFNFLNVSEIFEINGKGPITLTQEQVKQLNATLSANGFEAELVADEHPKFVVGYVKSTKPHPDSDHLLITETEVDNGETLQIVSGSPNMTDNIKVVVAKVGAIMPDGMIIWPGELRGVESNGMISSGRELHLNNAPQKKGALILPDDFVVGEAFDFEKGNHIFD
ncbi:YtpR family tRNA-binding protein [Pediococcus pentosaceus]